MARRREAQKRETTPDSRFHDKDVSLFINLMMRDGKKSVSENIFYATLEAIKVKLHVNDEQSLEVFKKALGNVMPQIEVKSRRVGGATYQVPVEVKEDRIKTPHDDLLIIFDGERYATDRQCRVDHFMP